MMTTEEMIRYDEFVELGIATPDELNLAFSMTDMNWSETFNRVLYIRTGYNSWEQFMEEL